MLNKKFKGIVAVALLSCMGLIACDKEVQAKPTNYDDKLIAFTEDDVYHNLVSIVEDATAKAPQPVQYQTKSYTHTPTPSLAHTTALLLQPPKPKKLP